MIMKKVRGYLVIGNTFSKYFMVGLLAFAVDTTTFVIMRNIFSLSLAKSNVIGMLVGLLVSFSLNHSWVFSKAFTPSKSALRFILFITNNIMVLYASTWLIVTLEEFTSHFGYTSIREVLCKMAVMSLVVVWNFTVYSKIIFREPKLKIGEHETIPT